MESHVIATTQAGVCTLTLNRPQKRNAISRLMLQQLQTALHTIEPDPAVRLVVLRGAGGQAFSAGGDLTEFRALDSAGVHDWIWQGNVVFNQLENLPKPTIAVLEGYVLGGGLELALSCDFRLAIPSATLGCPELQHGWLPGWGALARLRRLIGEARAKELVLLSEKLPAPEAYRLGLISRLCEPDELADVLDGLIHQLLAAPPAMLAMAKAALSDEHRRTTGPDLWFDVLATQAVQRQKAY